MALAQSMILGGSATDTSFVVSGVVTGSGDVGVAVSRSASMSNPTFGPNITPHVEGSVSTVKWTVFGLTGDTPYWAQMVDASTGALFGRVQRVKTQPTAGAFVRKWAVGSCQDNVPGAIHTKGWDDQLAWDADDCVFLGDLGYDGDAVLDTDPNSKMIGKLVTHTTGPGSVRPALNNANTIWIWSDHDLGQNGDAYTDAKNAMHILCVGLCMPVAYEDTRTPVRARYQAYNLGPNIRVICTDFRNRDRTVNTATDDATKTAWGSTQLDWIKAELLRPEAVKVLLIEGMWFGDPVSGQDKLISYRTEQQELADFIVENNVQVRVFGGDRHRCYHLSGANNPLGGFSVSVFSGYDKGILNLLPGEAHDVGRLFPPGESGLDGSIQVAQYGQVVWEDDGAGTITCTATCVGWDTTVAPDDPTQWERVEPWTVVDQWHYQADSPTGGIPVASPGAPIGALLDGTPGQVQFGAMGLGSKTAAGWKQLTGWRDFPGVDLTDASRPVSHGDTPGAVFAQGATVTFDCLLKGEPDLKLAALRTFELNTPLDGVSRALVVDDGGGPTMRWARTVARTIPQDAYFRHGPIPLSVQWRCADPRRYSLALHTAQVEVATPSGGLVYPLDYSTGLDYGTISGNDTAPVTNDGNTPTPVVVTFQGPLVNPTVATSLWSLSFAITLGGDETLTADTLNGTVTLEDGTDRFSSLTDDSTPIELALLYPGADTFKLTAASGAGSCIIAWRDATL